MIYVQLNIQEEKTKTLTLTLTLQSSVLSQPPVSNAKRVYSHSVEQWVGGQHFTKTPFVASNALVCGY